MVRLAGDSSTAPRAAAARRCGSWSRPVAAGRCRVSRQHVAPRPAPARSCRRSARPPRSNGMPSRSTVRQRAADPLARLEHRDACPALRAAAPRAASPAPSTSIGLPARVPGGTGDQCTSGEESGGGMQEAASRMRHGCLDQVARWVGPGALVARSPTDLDVDHARRAWRLRAGPVMKSRPSAPGRSAVAPPDR